MKKTIALVLSLLLAVAMMVPALASDAKPYIPMVSKGFQHQFWQIVKAGALDAAAANNVEVTFDGPSSESAIQEQVDMLNAVLAKNPVALCLAALDTDSVIEQLNAAKEKGIPIIAFDSGVPDAPEGTIVSTASTDNTAAGALAADHMFAIPEVKAAIDAATPEAPIVLSSFSQDATSGSIVQRTQGYIDQMFKLVSEVKPGAVEISGHDKYVKAAEGPVAVSIQVSVPASTNVTDCQTTAQGILAQPNVVSIFCSNSGSMDGVLAATADGSDLDRENGKYKDLIVIGFDSGDTLTNAIRQQWVYGAVTQDPYAIGYKAVELAVKTLAGETVDKIFDTGCQFYTHENIDVDEIARVLY